MTARIHRNFEFFAGVYFSGDYYVNSYTFDCTFNVETDSISEQNTALERIKYYIADCLEHSVMILDAEEQMIDKFMSTGMSVCTLPEEPYDQVVGIMLLMKLNAITEGRLVATDISIESRMSDGVSCLHSLEESVGPFAKKGWWNDPTMKISDIKLKSKIKNVVSIAKPKGDWADVHLGWDINPQVLPNSPAAEIVFASFDKTDK